MPVPTIEQLQQKEASLKQTIGEKGESLDKPKRRELAKKLRRVQRRRRRMVTEAVRRAPKPKEKPAETKAAETTGDAATESTEASKE